MASKVLWNDFGVTFAEFNDQCVQKPSHVDPNQGKNQ